MFEGNYADTCGDKFPLMSIGGGAEGLECDDPGARTPIIVRGNLKLVLPDVPMWLICIVKICHYALLYLILHVLWLWIY